MADNDENPKLSSISLARLETESRIWQLRRMRSTQFEDRFPFEEEHEEHRGGSHTDTLCETIKRLGYAENNQVRLYGEVFELLYDPVSIGDNFVFVDALDRRSGQVRRLRIPPTIVQMARTKRRAA